MVRPGRGLEAGRALRQAWRSGRPLRGHPRAMQAAPGAAPGAQAAQQRRPGRAWASMPSASLPGPPRARRRPRSRSRRRRRRLPPPTAARARRRCACLGGGGGRAARGRRHCRCEAAAATRALACLLACAGLGRAALPDARLQGCLLPHTCRRPAEREPRFRGPRRAQKWSKGKIKEKANNLVLFDKVRPCWEGPLGRAAAALCIGQGRGLPAMPLAVRPTLTSVPPPPCTACCSPPMRSC